MSTPRYLIIPQKAEKEVEALLSLDATQLTALADELLSGDAALSIRHEVIAKSLGIPNQAALDVVTAVRNLARQRKRYSLSFDAVMGDLGAMFSEQVQALEEEQRAALEQLVGSDAVSKIRSLRFSAVPHVLSARTVCDVRPVFDVAKKRIEKALVVTVLELEVHDHSMGNYKTIVVQLSPEALEELARSIAEAEQKLATIKKTFGDVVELIN